MSMQNQKEGLTPRQQEIRNLLNEGRKPRDISAEIKRELDNLYTLLLIVPNAKSKVIENQAKNPHYLNKILLSALRKAKEDKHHNDVTNRVLQYLYNLKKKQVSSINIEAYLAYLYAHEKHLSWLIYSSICLGLSVYFLIAVPVAALMASASLTIIMSLFAVFIIPLVFSTCAFLISLRKFNTPVQGLDAAIEEFELIVQADETDLSQKDENFHAKPEENASPAKAEKQEEIQASVQTDNSHKHHLISRSLFRNQTSTPDNGGHLISRRNSL